MQLMNISGMAQGGFRALVPAQGKRISFVRGFCYVIAQLAGAVVGAGLAKAVTAHPQFFVALAASLLGSHDDGFGQKCKHSALPCMRVGSALTWPIRWGPCR